ncbi:hypothetical protein XENOCAPTIV_020875 [Xenoophorus captivus]|uniref:Uncharacterized protein n=1 Tax=Xenoophorus captivus TaxID=1517983 RepID=A0ABV0RUA8_9TELE
MGHHHPASHTRTASGSCQQCQRIQNHMAPLMSSDSNFCFLVIWGYSNVVASLLSACYPSWTAPEQPSSGSDDSQRPSKGRHGRQFTKNPFSKELELDKMLPKSPSLFWSTNDLRATSAPIGQELTSSFIAR